MAIPNNPTFNRFNQQSSGSSLGYYSRTMFSFVGETNNLTASLWTTSSTGITTTNCNGISNLTSSYSSNSWGSHIVPAYYWRDGKVVRLKGTFYVTSSATTQTFNMRFGLGWLSAGNETTDWYGIQNNNNNHTIAQSEMIVNFENIIACSVAQSGSYSVFVSNGFYSETQEGNEESANKRRSTWTSIWNNTNQGFLTSSYGDIYPIETYLAMNLAGTNITGSIKLLHLSIEELA
jgi:hypothetical protein